MVSANARTRAVGARAVAGRSGFPQLTTPTGGTMEAVTGVSAPGFNPLDLLFGAMASCLVLSVRSAASQLGVLDSIVSVTVEVTGEKAPEPPARIERFDILFDIAGDLDHALKHQLIEAAEGEICTISNTLRGEPTFAARLAGA